MLVPRQRMCNKSHAWYSWDPIEERMNTYTYTYTDVIHYILLYIYAYYVGEGSGNPLQYSCLETPMDGGSWLAAVHGVTKSRTWLSDFTLTFHFDALEKEMATHSSVLAWRIPGLAEPGGLPSVGSHGVRHNWCNLAAAACILCIIYDYIYIFCVCVCVSVCIVGVCACFGRKLSVCILSVH